VTLEDGKTRVQEFFDGGKALRAGATRVREGAP
jgi:hypothetical protein